jgi:hypothetical protein
MKPQFEGYNIHIDTLGYPRIWLKGQGLKPIHRLVYTRAHGPTPKGIDIHHIDGNKMNWALDNLIAVTHEEHMQIHRKEPLRQRGVDPDKYSICWDCRKAKLREEFCQDKNRGDGISRRCKTCQSTYVKGYDEKNKVAKSERGKRLHAAIKADPEKWKALQERSRREYLARKAAKKEQV